MEQRNGVKNEPLRVNTRKFVKISEKIDLDFHESSPREGPH